jgi:hypothetical protein
VWLINRFSGRELPLSLITAAALLATGCSRGSDYPVHGTVYLDDEPAKELAGATVTFNSTELHRSASGDVQANGTYQLGNLIPGTYRVTVSPPETASGSERGGRHPAAKPVAFEPLKDIDVTVEPKTNDIPIKLHRKKTTPR